MLSRESRHEIFGFWQRDFTKPFMLKSSINSYSLWKKKSPQIQKSKKLSRCILNEHTCHIYFITLSGSYVRSLFSKSKPASDRVGEPVNEVAGNFLRNRLYLKEQASGKKHDITTMQSRKKKEITNEQECQTTSPKARKPENNREFQQIYTKGMLA